MNSPYPIEALADLLEQRHNERTGGMGTSNDRTLAGKLSNETVAAQTLLANIRDTLGEDDELCADMIEGETDFWEVMQRAVDRIGELDAFVKGLTDYQKSVGERKSRFEAQAENLRTAISVGMSTLGIKKREMSGATLTLRDKAREPVVVDESQIPSQYWKPQAPKLDRKALRDSAKSGEEIPGVELDNGGVSLTIRRS